MIGSVVWELASVLRANHDPATACGPSAAVRFAGELLLLLPLYWLCDALVDLRACVALYADPDSPGAAWCGAGSVTACSATADH
jgi:hypothetical protein